MSVADMKLAYRIKDLKGGAFVGVPTTVADCHHHLGALYNSIVEEPKIAELIAKHAM